MFTSLPEPFPAADQVLSVSALNRLARDVLEQRFPLMWVSGEVSNLTRAASGHVYFSLKDETAQVRCVMFRNRAQLVPFQLQNGQQVEARVLVSLYEARGDFQLNVEAMRRAGLGALFERFTRLKDKLAAEGLFAPARKRAIPRLPKKIGVVSSLAAAALHDVLVALKRRAPHVPVIIYPVPVQGEGAAARIAERLAEAGTRNECDVLILARGGGSIEDLWAFNEEVLARAIAACPIPVVCGVGHETDVTIADFVADMRAATPTAAAELVSATHLACAQSLTDQHAALSRAMHRMLEQRMQRLDVLAGRLQHPKNRIELARVRLESLANRASLAIHRGLSVRRGQIALLQSRYTRARPAISAHQTRIAQLAGRLQQAIAQQLATRHTRVAGLAINLTHLDPRGILARGYSIVRNEAGDILHRADEAAIGARITVQLGEGELAARVEKP